VLLLVAFLALVFAPSVYLQTVFDGVTEALAAFVTEHPVMGPFVFVGLGIASVLLGPFTSVPLVPFAVAIWELLPTLLLLLSGWLVGNCIAYAIGRFAGQPLVVKIVGQKQVDAWIGTLEKHMKPLTMFIFRLAVPSETGYVFGLISYRFSHYLLITFLAELPFAVLAVFTGDAFAATQWESFWVLLAVWAGIIGLAYILLARHLRENIS
jgi:uncharacterized membrane protein YdjX (TVP38/TMEM64 family)